MTFPDSSHVFSPVLRQRWKRKHAPFLAARIVLIVACAAFAPALANAATMYSVALDTTPLIGHAAGPFSLDFQLTDGSGTGNAGTTVTVDRIAFGLGMPVGAPTMFGGASGAIDSAVTLTDGHFFNELFQQFRPGTTLSFVVTVDGVGDAPTPDEFSFGILDSTLSNIPTTGPGDALLTIDNGSGFARLSSYATAVSGPTAGGPAIVMAAPQVASAPEPGAFLLLGSGLIVFGLIRLRHRRKL